MEGTSRNGNSVHIWSITARKGFLSDSDDFHPIEYKDKPLEPIPRLLSFDKVAGRMSSSIDVAAVLIEHYRWERNLQKIVEITTPIGWAHGFINYPKVMKKWSWNGLPPDDWGQIVGRSDTNEGRMLKESHTYEKRPT